jgi:peptide/nickel transport system substrate-binding protein
MSHKKITRRNFLILSATGLSAAALAACAAPAAPTAAPENTAPPAPAAATDTPVAIKAVEATSTPVPTVEASKYKEAPKLADMVAAGKLPTVDKRLPQDPMVIQPVDSVGKYGGTMNLLTQDSAELGNVQLKFYDPPIRWKPDMTGYEAGLASSYEWSADGKTFTFHFRKDVKWSDGEPFTTADLKFWWNDLVNDPDYGKLYSSPWYFVNKEGTRVVDVSFPDDFTMVWTSSGDPIYIAPLILAQGFWEWNPVMKPMHYLKQFHTKYTPTAKPEDMEKMDKWYRTPGYPCLMAWQCVNVAEDGTKATFERNPYYWKVDTDGNQLPYIDTVSVDIVKDPKLALLQTSQGKYEVMFRGAGASPNDIPFLNEQAATGGYHLLKNWNNGSGSWPAYMINQDYTAGGKNYPDDTPEHAKEIHDLLCDKNFRRGLAISVDRKRMIQVVWGGIGNPVGATISPQSWHFASPKGQEVFKDWQTRYAGYDADKATQYFTDAGMKKGADGFYTLPSGKPFTLVVDVTDWPGQKISEDAGAEIQKQFEAAGIKTDLKNVIGQPDANERQIQGYYMLRCSEASEMDLWTYPDEVFPVRNNREWPLEGHWRETSGAEGIKPLPGSPAEKLQALYDKGLAEPDIQKRHEIVWEAVGVHLEEGPFILGISGDQQVPVVVKDYMRNILDFGVIGPWAPGTPGNQHPAQWWMEI